MDVTFVANDTRGGVEPYLALAAEAAQRGHTVRAVAPPQHEPEFVRIGARFVPLHGAERAQAIVAEGPVSLREMSKRVTDLTGRWAIDAAAGLAGTDLVVSGIGGMSIARPVAQAVGADLLRAHLQPLEAPSSRYPGPLASYLEVLGPAGRLLSHRITAAGVSLLSRSPESAARAALGLRGGPVDALPTILYGFSGAMVPVESDAMATRIPTGYWALTGSADIDPQVREFVERPGPTVSVGFGSMVTDHPEQLRELVVDAARLAGARVVLLLGWGALGQPDDSTDATVLALPSVAHSWLFPRMGANVHHGGAGTTGAALTAGRPTVIVPFGADQPFWAARAHALGVSPPPIRRRRLTAKVLGEAMRRALTDVEMARRASELGEVLRGERGVEAAVDIIEAIAARR